MDRDFWLAIVMFSIGFLLGFVSGEDAGYNKGALAQKNGQITWHTNTTSTVSFTVNK